MRRRPGGTAWIIAAIIVLGSSAGCGSGDPASVSRDPVPSNLDRMRSLVAAIGASVLDSAGTTVGDTVALDVDSSDASWVVRTEISALLGRSGRTVVTGGGATREGSRWNVRGAALGAEYRDIRKPGMFSGAVVDRIITVSFTSELTRGGGVTYAGTTSRSAVDTVDEGNIADFETGSPESTRGAVPGMETFDRFIEPLVIIGAAGVAIFLFFQVRS